MNKETWISAIRTFEPAYDSLKEMLERSIPRIRAALSFKDRSWCITLEEVKFDWEDSLLDKRVAWVTEQLKEWPDVRRMAHDMWYFKRKRDAMKFQTLYNLVWASE